MQTLTPLTTSEYLRAKKLATDNTPAVLFAAAVMSADQYKIDISTIVEELPEVFEEARDSEKFLKRMMEELTNGK